MPQNGAWPRPWRGVVTNIASGKAGGLNRPALISKRAARDQVMAARTAQILRHSATTEVHRSPNAVALTVTSNLVEFVGPDASVGCGFAWFALMLSLKSRVVS